MEETKISFHENGIGSQERMTVEKISDIFERQDSKRFFADYDIDFFLNEFKSDKINGILDLNTIPERRAKFGSNVLPDPKNKSFFKMILEALNNLTLKILLTCAVIGVILHLSFPSSEKYGDYDVIDFIDSISIFTSVIIVTFVSAVTDFIQQKNFLEINRLKDEFFVSVVRSSMTMQIVSTELVVGDILLLKSGDKVPADCLYISGHNLKIDNSQQTGESCSVEISEEFPFILNGSLVEEGDTKVIVAAVGVNSQSGKVMAILTNSSNKSNNNEKEIKTNNDFNFNDDNEDSNNDTPLEKKLNKTALMLTYIGLVVSGVLFFTKLIIWGVKVSKLKWKTAYINELVEPIMVCVTIFISIVPEGLPLAVTLSLGFSMKVMVKESNFVRHLSACETMGGATTICSDKTGTLTQNLMKVVQFYVDNRNSDSYSDTSSILAPKANEIIRNSIIFNTSCYEHEGNLVGQGSECALVRALELTPGQLNEFRNSQISAEIYKIFEFNSIRKSMTTYYKSNQNSEKFSLVCYTKGAPDLLLQRCTKIMASNGSEKSLTIEEKNQINDKIFEYSNNALRTILIAYKNVFSLTDKDGSSNINDTPTELTFVSLVGIEDPLRPEVFQSIEMCKKAGVVVRMVTGDFLNTARAIATQCGIIEDENEDIVLTGEEFSNMDKLELIEKLPRLRVLARSSPIDKLRLVSILMDLGEVVAVTGDGSNDAPALKKANVGLSMGKSGTELAKVASDIVILDDNFKSIVTSLKWGRCVYDNVRSFLQYLLTMNIPSVVLVFVGYLSKDKPPFTAVQLLWANVIVGSLGSLALATSRPTDNLLERKPYGESDPIVSNLMYRNMVGIAVYQILFLFLIFFNVIEKDAEYEVVLTMMFSTFVFSQIFNLFHSKVSGPNIKVIDGLFKNLTFLLIFVFDLIVQTIVIVFGGVVFSTVRMNLRQWLIVLAISAGNIIIGFFVRMIPVSDKTEKNLEINRKLKKEMMIAKLKGNITENLSHQELTEYESNYYFSEENNNDEIIIL